MSAAPLIVRDRREKIAFAMRLHPGRAEEYRRRHDAIPADLVALLKEAGIEDCSFHLAPGTGTLFGVLWRRRDHGMATLPDHPVMKRWWAAMTDIMETHPSNEPEAVPLEPMFFLP